MGKNIKTQQILQEKIQENCKKRVSEKSSHFLIDVPKPVEIYQILRNISTSLSHRKKWFKECNFIVARGFDLSKSFDTIRSLETWKLNEEKHRGLGGKNSEVILIVPYTSSITDTDKEYCLEQLKKLREDVPGTKLFYTSCNEFYLTFWFNWLADATIKFLTHGSKDRWSDLVGDPSNDIFSVGVLTTQDISGPVNQLLSSIKRGNKFRCLHSVLQVFIID